MGVLDGVLIAAGYLSGSIPWGLILYRIFKGDDIRKHGSGNIGATNVARNAGYKIGIATLLLDIAKGLVPILVSRMAGLPDGSWTPAIVAVAAILGHMFPVWLGFKGGKGVATAAGVFFGLSWPMALVALFTFAVSFFIFRIVSLSSINAALAFAVASLGIGTYAGMTQPLQIAALVAASLVIFKHHENIRRLINGTEKRFSASSKNKAEGNE